MREAVFLVQEAAQQGYKDGSCPDPLLFRRFGIGVVRATTSCT